MTSRLEGGVAQANGAPVLPSQDVITITTRQQARSLWQNDRLHRRARGRRMVGLAGVAPERLRPCDD